MESALVPPVRVASGCDGKLVLGLTSQASLTDLVGFLTTPTADGGPGCTAALNLGGGEEAGLLIRAGEPEASLGATDFRVANAIVVDPERSMQTYR